jgi:hypothetical protein
MARMSQQARKELLLVERRECEKLQTAMKDGDIAHWYSKTQHEVRGYRVQIKRGDADLFVPCGQLAQWMRALGIGVDRKPTES